MSIRSYFKKNQKTFSFELFPPKTEEGKKTLYHNLVHLKKLNPTFISVTMGAMGSHPENTFEIVKKIQEDHQIPGVAHLTCVNVSRDSILESLSELKQMKIQNLLCLRGDPSVGSTEFHPPKNGFRYASELVHFIREKTGDAFSIGVAGYPEGHVECPDKEKDLLHLKMKVDAGAEYILTQLFFDNDDYFRFVERARKIGISIPIIPGIMPITNFIQLEKFTSMCGAKIPKPLFEKLEKMKNDLEAIRNYGVEYAVKQCEELLKNDAPGLHFYILNQIGSIQKIYQKLQL